MFEVTNYKDKILIQVGKETHFLETNREIDFFIKQLQEAKILKNEYQARTSEESLQPLWESW